MKFKICFHLKKGHWTTNQWYSPFFSLETRSCLTQGTIVIHVMDMSGCGGF